MNLATSSGVSSPYVFRGNSIYDPDFTSTGYSAMGCATLSNLYGRFMVTGCSIRVRAFSNGGVGALLAVIPTLVSGTISSSSLDYSENPYAKNLMLGNSGAPPRPLSIYMPTSKMIGQVLDTNNSHATGGNPATEWFWQLKIDRLNGTEDVECDIVVDLVYYVEAYRRSSYATRI